MTVSSVQWRAVIGTLNCLFLAIFKSRTNSLKKNLSSLFETLFLCIHYFENTLFSLLTLLYVFILLRCHRDIELSLGPKKSKENTLSVCHWNLNCT